MLFAIWHSTSKDIYSVFFPIGFRECTKCHFQFCLDLTIYTNTTNVNVESAGKLPKPVFRSYKPADEELAEQARPEAEPAEVEEQIKVRNKPGKPNLSTEKLFCRHDSSP